MSKYMWGRRRAAAGLIAGLALLAPAGCQTPTAQRREARHAESWTWLQEAVAARAARRPDKIQFLKDVVALRQKKEREDLSRTVETVGGYFH